MDLGTRMRYALIHATRGYFSANHDNIVSDYDLPYYEGEDFFDRKHRLNVHYHAPLLKSGCPKEADVSLEESTQADKKLPVVVFIHGGGWKRGDRNYFFDAYNNVGKAIAAQGFVCVVPSYRLSSPGEGDVKHPHHAYDVACALYWVHNQIGRYGGDTNMVYLAGHSAGGHLAVLLALDLKYLAELGLGPDFVKGVVGICGVYDLITGNQRYLVPPHRFFQPFTDRFDMADTESLPQRCFWE